jgi:hypothetical protein
MMTLTKAKGQFSESAIDDEIVVMSLDSGTFFSLSETGRSIWELLDRHSDRAELLTALAQTYGQDETAIAAELDEFLASLGAAGLLVCT